jgi:hypothetical protein
MSINPKTSLIINLAIAVLGVVAGSATYFTGIFGQGVATNIVSSAGFALALIGAVNTALHAFSSSTPGPLANSSSTPSPPAKA